MERISKFDRPMLAAPMTVRVVYRKIGNLQYFSHLDLQRTWQRVLVRASIPMWYTQGFNPHSKITYGVPLPVGTEGLCEMMDLRIDRSITCEEIRDQLNEELTDEMRVSEVYIPTTAFMDIAWGEYDITISTPGDPAESAGNIHHFLNEETEPVVMTRKSKAGEKEFDIRPLIHSAQVTAEPDGTVRIHAILSTGNQNNLNPEFVIKALRANTGILPEDGAPASVWYRILRLGFYTSDGLAAGERFR